MINLLRRAIYKIIETEVETAITNRIVMFHDALIEREQIAPPSTSSQIARSTPKEKPNLSIVNKDAENDQHHLR